MQILFIYKKKTPSVTEFFMHFLLRSVMLSCLGQNAPWLNPDYQPWSIQYLHLKCQVLFKSQPSWQDSPPQTLSWSTPHPRLCQGCQICPLLGTWHSACWPVTIKIYFIPIDVHVTQANFFAFWLDWFRLLEKTFFDSFWNYSQVCFDPARRHKAVLALTQIGRNFFIFKMQGRPSEISWNR